MSSWNPFRRNRSSKARKNSYSPFTKLTYRPDLERFEPRWYPGDMLTALAMASLGDVSMLFRERLLALFDQTPHNHRGNSVPLAPSGRSAVVAEDPVADLSRISLLSTVFGSAFGEANSGHLGQPTQVSQPGEQPPPVSFISLEISAWDNPGTWFADPLMNLWGGSTSGNTRLRKRLGNLDSAESSPSHGPGVGGDELPGRSGVPVDTWTPPTPPRGGESDPSGLLQVGGLPLSEIRVPVRPPTSEDDPPDGGDPMSGPGPGGSRRPFLQQNFGRLPLAFEPNQGQVDVRAQYVARGKGYSIFLRPTEATLVLQKPLPNPQHRAVLRMQVVGGNPLAQPAGLDRLPGRSNYLKGNDPTRWRTNIPHFGKVAYRNVYPGIDLIHYGKQRQLEFDFVVHPGASPSTIQLAFAGAGAPRIDALGNLILPTLGDEVIPQSPILYQLIDGTRRRVNGRYILLPLNKVGFQVGAYDLTRPLYIDPVILYSTYLGGSSDEAGNGIALDSSGNAYLVGNTNSNDFPEADPANYRGSDVFIAKLNSDGTAILYATYLGGTLTDEGKAIAVDRFGSPHITGSSSSTDFPTTPSAFRTFRSGTGYSTPDAFVAALTPDGAGLLYSTYLGGDSDDKATGIAVTSTGEAVVTGSTGSIDFPLQAPYQSARAGYGVDAFVTKLSADGSRLVYSTYLGGSGLDQANAITLDSAGAAYITGSTTSFDFPDPSSRRNAAQKLIKGVLFKSTDACVSWRAVNTGLPVDEVYSLTINPTTPSILYAATPLGVYKTLDGGTLWSPTTLFGHSITFLGIDRSSPSNVYAANSQTLYKSADAGSTWTIIRTTSSQSPFIQLLVVNSKVYLGIQEQWLGQGIYRSLDGGGTWNPNLIEHGSEFLETLDYPYGSGVYASSYLDDRASVTYNDGSTWYLSDPYPDGAPGALGIANGTLHVTASDSGFGQPPFSLYANFPWPGPWELQGNGFGHVKSMVGGGGHVFLGGDGVADASPGSPECDYQVESVNKLALDPTNPNILYAATNKSWQPDAFVAKLDPSGSTLVYSTFLGGTRTDTGNAIAVDSQFSAYVAGETHSKDFPVANAYQTSLKGTRDAFVTKLSPDGSAFLFSTYLGGNTPPDYDVDKALSISVGADRSVYVVGTTKDDFPLVNPIQANPGGGGILKSFDYGNNWRHLPLGATDVVAIDPLTPAVVFAGQYGLSRSLNGGLTWLPTNLEAGWVTSIAFASDNPIAMYAVSGYGGVLWKSVDGGMNWNQTAVYGSRSVAIPRSTSSPVYASTGTRVAKSIDNGANWSYAELSALVNTIAVADPTPEVLYAGTGNGVFKSITEGATWSPSGLSGKSIAVVATDPITPTRVFAGVTQAFNPPPVGIYISTNGGQSWDVTGLPNLHVYSVAIDAASPLVVYAGTSNGLYKSETGGVTWDLSAFSGIAVKSVAIDPTDSSIVYAGMGTGGYTDAFVTRLDPSGSALLFSSYFGGAGEESGSGVAVDADGNIFVTGTTSSPNLPTEGAIQRYRRGPSDAFVTKISQLPEVNIVAAINSVYEDSATAGRFYVYRNGPLDAELLVNYRISGTASPVYDYDALQGSVTIPANSPIAEILVTPVNDGVPEGSESVIVTLKKDPTYSLGIARYDIVNILDPLGKEVYVLDANSALTVTPGTPAHEFAGWGVDLRAQTLGITLGSISWDVSAQQAPDAVNVSGTATSRLTFNWNTQVPSIRDNVISLTVTPYCSDPPCPRPFTQRLVFRVVPSSSPSWVDGSARPTSYAYWPAVLPPDGVTNGQETVDGPNYRIGLATGELQTAHTLPSVHPSIPPLEFRYSSLGADRRPVFLDHYEVPVGTSLTTLAAQLRLNGVVGSVVYYRANDLIPGDITQLALQANATQVSDGMATGRYPYSVEIVPYTSAGSLPTVTHSGQVSIIKPDAFPWVGGWSLANVQRLYPFADGAILQLPGGASLWFKWEGTSYTTPPGDFSTLVKIGNPVTGYIRTLKDGTQISFNADGRQTGIVDLNLRRTTFTHDASMGRLLGIHDFTNRLTYFTYGASSVVITDPAGRDTTVAFDTSPNNGITSIVEPDPDGIGPLASPRTTFSYAASSPTGRVTQITDPRSNPTAFAYNFASRVGTITRANGATALVTAVQLRGLLPDGSTSLASPATMTLAAGARSEYRDFRGNSWYSRFDWLGFGHVTQDQDPYLNMSLAYRNRDGLTWIGADPRGNRTHFKFDAKGNPTTITYADEVTDRYTYNATHSKPESRVDPNGNRTTYQYDGRGNLEKVIDPYANETLYTYTQDGFLLAERNARNFYTTYAYDNWRRRTQMTLPDDDADPNNNPRYLYEYDYPLDPNLSAGNLTKVTDPQNRVTSFNYDRLNRRTQTDEAWNATGAPPMRSATMVYDAAGNLESTTTGISASPNYQVRLTTSYVNDSLNRQTQVIEATNVAALTRQTVTAYDSNDNVLSVTNPRGFVTSHSYDRANRPSETIEAWGQPTLQRTTTVLYDAAGNVIETVAALGHIARSTYDNRNRQVSLTEAAETSDQRTTDTVYDGNGNILRVTRPQNRVTSYAYDKLNQRSHVVEGFGSADARLATMMYDVVGNLVAVTTGQAPAYPAYHKPVTVSYVYDAQNRRTRVVEAPGVPGLERTTQTNYDLGGSVLFTTHPNGMVTSYAYDDLNRQVRVIEAQQDSGLRRTTTVVYDAAGNIQQTIKPRVYDSVPDAEAPTPRYITTSVAYDALSRRTQVDEAAGSPDMRTSTFLYDSMDNIVSATTGQSTNADYRKELTVTYLFDALNRRTEVTEAANVASLSRRTRTLHDAAGNVVSVINPRGAAIVYAYDNLNRPIREYNGVGLTETTYDSNDNILSVRSPRGALATFAHDVLNRRTEMTEDATGPDRRTVTTVYDASNNVIRSIDGRGFITSYAYDTLNRRTDTVEAWNTAVQRSATMVYDTRDNLLSITTGVSPTVTYQQRVTTSYGYDTYDRRTRVIDAHGVSGIEQTTITTYDALDNVRAVANPWNQITTFTYDSLGRRTAAKGPTGDTTTSVYDAAGNIRYVIDALNFVASYGYDALRRRTVEISPYGTADGTGMVTAFATEYQRRTTMTYDPADNVLVVVRPSGVTSPPTTRATHTYDGLNRRAQTIDPEGGKTFYSYDAEDNLTQVSDPAGFTTKYGFDALNRRNKITDPNNKSLTLAYDKANNLTSRTDRIGRRRDFQYDQLNRLQTETWVVRNGETDTVVGRTTFSHDAASNLLSAANSTDQTPVYTYAMTYDSLNRAKTKQAPFGLTLTYTYDTENGKRRLQLNDSKGGITTSVYDHGGRLETRKLTVGATAMRADLAYNASSQLTTLAYARTLDGVQKVATGQYTYDEFGRGIVKTLVWRRETGGGPNPFDSYDYFFDQLGRSYFEGRRAYPDATGSWQTNYYTYSTTYAYNRTNQLSSEASTAGEGDPLTNNYGYDPNGNRSGTGYQVGVGNRVLADPNATYTYDAEGNLRTRHSIGKTWTFTYDHANRLTGHEFGNGSGTVEQRATYTYDAFGNRMERRVDPESQSGLPTVTHYAYDGKQLIADLYENNSLQLRYLTGDSQGQVFARGGDGLGDLWYLPDRHGSIHTIIDGTGGLKKRMRYQGFATWGITLGTLADRFEYLGKEIEYYFGGFLALDGSRWYFPTIGKWLSEDPRGLEADLNPYRYERNQPTSVGYGGSSWSGTRVSQEPGLLDRAKAAVNSAIDGLSSIVPGFAQLDRKNRELDERVNEAFARYRTKPAESSPSSLRLFASAAAEGIADGSAIAANTFTFGLISPLNDHVQGLVAENGAMYAAAQGFVGFGRDVLIAVATGGAAGLAHATTHAAAKGYLKTFVAERVVGATVGVGKNLWQTGVLSDGKASGWDYVVSGLHGLWSGTVDPFATTVSALGAAGGYAAGKYLGGSADAKRGLLWGDIFGGMAGGFGRSALENGLLAGTRASATNLVGVAGGLAYGALTGSDPLQSISTALMLTNQIQSARELLRRVCFAAGTPLLTPTGDKPIEQFKPGDAILTRRDDSPDAPVVVSYVEEVFTNFGRLLHLHVNGRVIRTTGEHPFWVKDKGWTEAARLLAGDLLSTHDGQWVAIEEVYDTGEFETVYNLRVLEYHTYFVGSRGWGFSVWAHNTYLAGATQADQKKFHDGYDAIFGNSQGMKVGKHGAMPSPRPGKESHHGVMSAWVKNRSSTYDPDLAPAILMPDTNHRATFGVFNKWRAEMRAKMGGTFDWSNVTEAQARALSEKMFDAAGVPSSVRQDYWKEFAKMKTKLGI